MVTFLIAILTFPSLEARFFFIHMYVYSLGYLQQGIKKTGFFFLVTQDAHRDSLASLISVSVCSANQISLVIFVDQGRHLGRLIVM